MNSEEFGVKGSIMDIIYETTLPLMDHRTNRSSQFEDSHTNTSSNNISVRHQSVPPLQNARSFQDTPPLHKTQPHQNSKHHKKNPIYPNNDSFHNTRPPPSNRRLQSILHPPTPKKAVHFEPEQYAESEDTVGHFYLQIVEPPNSPQNKEFSTPSGECRAPKTSRSKIDSPVQYAEIVPTPPNLNKTDNKLVKAVKQERNTSICHLLIIISSIASIVALTKVVIRWETEIRRCPIFVRASNDYGIYWGNEKMASCHYVAYMPALSLIMSLSMLLFHGSIVQSWRKRKNAPQFLLSRSYSKIILCIELIELVAILSATSVLIDGIRLTCLSFQLNPWVDERPENCKEGYRERDEIYGISNTYTGLMVGLISLVLSSCASFVSSCFYLFKALTCRN